MDCFDTSLGLHALVGASLVVAGANLMMHVNKVARGYGAYCFAFGYFILGVCASGNHLGDANPGTQRYLLGLGSAVAVVAGTFMMYYHVQEKVKSLLQDSMNNLPAVRDNLIASIPVIDHVLIYGGFIGLVMAVGLNNDGSVNMVRGGMALVALLVIGHTKTKMVDALVTGDSVQRHQLAHILSWGLLVLAIAYKC
jgi:hypothetical protein